MTLPQRVFRNRNKEKALRSPQHRAYVRTYACCVPMCNSEARIDACHVRTGTDGGMGKKPSDFWLVSMCRDHHREQHQIGEPAFEAKYGLDLKSLAREFAAASPPLRKLRTA